MTLKEKIFHELFDDELQFKKDNILPRLSDIADDFAIGFRDFCNKRAIIKPLSAAILTSDELLNIYKIEEGL